MATAVRLNGVTKTYKKGGVAQDALKNISLSIDENEAIAVMGPSGSGKSTLLQLVGGLDKPTNGTLEVFGADVNKLSDARRSKHRLQTVGFVFQQFYLQPFLSAVDNVALPMRLNSMSASKARMAAGTLLDRVGLSDKKNSRPAQLSGGEMQRVAIARALANNPKILLADEPTGNLDRENADSVIKIFKELSKDGTTVVVVTHDEKVAKEFGRVVQLENGTIESDKLAAPKGSTLESVSVRSGRTERGVQAHGKVSTGRSKLKMTKKQPVRRTKSDGRAAGVGTLAVKGGK
jgi:ABC-type lipoprotein export system ATPase subunit